MKRTIEVLVIAALALLVPAQAMPAEGPHVVTGAVRLRDGSLFRIDAQALYPEAVGKAWLSHPRTPLLREITIDCLEVAWHMPVYPIPPYLPFHLAEASGLAADGTRFYITAYDLIPEPAGFGDRLILATQPGEGACGATQSIGTPVEWGDITIGP